MKTAVIYWSGTGNTEAMAKAAAEGANAELFSVSEFSGNVADYDAIAFGCPAMGAEVLEESEFQPMFDDCCAKLNGKKIGLFGSWGWGGGEWMQNWEAQCRELGAAIASEPVTCANQPEEDTLAACKNLGAALA